MIDLGFGVLTVPKGEGRRLLDDLVSRDVLATHGPATTNLYLYRLSKSVIAARGGALTGTWSAEHRRALGARLLNLSDSIEIQTLLTALSS